VSTVSTGKHGFGIWSHGSVAVTAPARLGKWNAHQFWEIFALVGASHPVLAVERAGRALTTGALMALVMALPRLGAPVRGTHGVRRYAWHSLAGRPVLRWPPQFGELYDWMAANRTI
jgi:hypothetical protein